ncbi:hypothetical protein ACS0PU_005484 [Formica fusca]
MANRCSGQMPVVSQIRADYRLPRLALRPVSWNGADKRALSYHAEMFPSPLPSLLLVHCLLLLPLVLLRPRLCAIQRERTERSFIHECQGQKGDCHKSHVNSSHFAPGSSQIPSR